MKRTRKGFTLIELLIVIAILGSLSAMMSVNITNSSAMAKAKAASIANNVALCKTAAAIVYAESMDNKLAIDGATIAGDFARYVPDYESFLSSGSDSKIHMH